MTIEMVALELNGTRPSPPVTLTVEAPLDTRETHPDFLWQPASFTIGQLEWGAGVINISHGSPCNEECK